MSTTISRRLGRRMTAMGAGAALVAAGLSLGVMAPADALSPVSGGVSDAFGNALSGRLNVFEKDADGVFEHSTYIYVNNNGFIEGNSLSEGVYKFAFETDTYTEYYKDQTTLAASQEVTVAAGDAPVLLGAWTVDQPYLVGTVSNAAGKPLSEASIYVQDATTGNSVGDNGVARTDDKGVFKIPTQAAPVKVSFAAAGYAYEYFTDKGSFTEADAVTPLPGGANFGNVVLTAGGAITGRVTSDAGVPLEFIEVSSSRGAQSDYTDKNGVFTIKNVAVGPQTVYYYDPIGEYASERFNNVPVTGEATPIVVGQDQLVPGADAALTPLPADPTKTVELTGGVKDSLGVPVVGAAVTAFTTPLGGESESKSVETVYSNRQGIYNFTNLEKVQGENAFKVKAGAFNQGDDDAFALYGSWFGGSQKYDATPEITLTPGTPVGAVDFVFDRAGGIAGSVTGLAGSPLTPTVGVVGVSDAIQAESDVVFEADSTFESRSLRPGTYKIYFNDVTGYHAGEWWKDKAKFEDAVVVTVKPGELVSGLNAVLGNQLTATQRPEIGAYPWVGKALTADSGVWNLQTDTAFKYEWLVGSTVVGKGDTFVPTTAQLGDRLTLRVTAENGRLVGATTSAASAKVGYQPKVKVKVKGTQATFKVKANPVKAKKVKGSVVVKEVVDVKDDGTIKYKKVAKAKIKKGKGAVSLSKLKKGKHKLVFFFVGKGQVGSTEVSKKVKIKR